MAKFRGWHIIAGIAAMLLTGYLGKGLGLSNTAAFMASGVAFVAVSMWVDSRLTRRRRAAAARAATGSDGASAGAAGGASAGVQVPPGRPVNRPPVNPGPEERPPGH